MKLYYMFFFTFYLMQIKSEKKSIYFFLGAAFFAGFLAAGFLAAGFLAAGFLAAFLAAGFLAAFFAGFLAFLEAGFFFLTTFLGFFFFSTLAFSPILKHPAPFLPAAPPILRVPAATPFFRARRRGTPAF